MITDRRLDAATGELVHVLRMVLSDREYRDGEARSYLETQADVRFEGHLREVGRQPLDACIVKEFIAAPYLGSSEWVLELRCHSLPDTSTVTP